MVILLIFAALQIYLLVRAYRGMTGHLHHLTDPTETPVPSTPLLDEAPAHVIAAQARQLDTYISDGITSLSIHLIQANRRK
jgi:hypothetical protein